MPKTKKSKKESSEEIVISLDQFAVPGAIILAGVIIALAVFLTNKNADNGVDTGSEENVAGEETAAQNDSEFASASTTIADSPYSGNKDTAKVAIVEFSDYLCSYCQRHTTETYPSIVKNYVDTGDVIYVYRDFAIHGEIAEAQAMAGKCVYKDAGLDVYTKYHKDVFMTETYDAIYDVASDAGANRDNIQTCVESGDYKNTIASDYSAGEAAGVQGTPGFVIGTLDSDGNVTGVLIPGAYPYDTFVQVLDRFLSE